MAWTYNFWMVFGGSLLLGGVASWVGCFTYLQRKSLVSDAVSHSILPGLVLAFMLTGSRSPWVLTAGAFASGAASLWAIRFLQKRTFLKTDSAIALVLSIFFSVGMLLLSRVQSYKSGSQAGLDQMLFGKAAAMQLHDLYAYLILAGLLVLGLIFYYPALKLYTFNADFARMKGISGDLMEMLLSGFLIAAILLGVQSVGVVLMASLLIVPASVALMWSVNMRSMMWISFGVAAFSSALGVYVSAYYSKMPTGPVIVLAMWIPLLVAILFSPTKGLIYKHKLSRSNKNKILMENLLKAFYHLHEAAGRVYYPIQLNELLAKRSFSPVEFNKGLKLLLAKHWIFAKEGAYQLTESGKLEARRVVRLHRLWELYLSEKLSAAPDHIHGSAETIEHLITPEIEAQLLEELNYPSQDPHSKRIPYNPRKHGN